MSTGRLCETIATPAAPPDQLRVMAQFAIAGLALSMTILGLNLMGDGLASIFGARQVAR